MVITGMAAAPLRALHLVPLFAQMIVMQAMVMRLVPMQMVAMQMARV
jgi:hypothetical protein